MLHDIGLQSRFQFAHAVKDTPAQTLLGEVAKEAFHHVEPGGAGGCEMHVQAGMPLQPVFHLGVFVRGVVVRDEVYFSVRWGLPVDEPKEAQPFLMPMLTPAGREHLPVQRVQRGKERGGAVSFVVVGHRLGAAFFKRQTLLGPIQGLDLALLIQRKYQRMLGRVQIQSHDLFQFLGKLRVVAELETQ